MASFADRHSGCYGCFSFIVFVTLCAYGLEYLGVSKEYSGIIAFIIIMMVFVGSHLAQLSRS